MKPPRARPIDLVLWRVVAGGGYPALVATWVLIVAVTAVVPSLIDTTGEWVAFFSFVLAQAIAAVIVESSRNRFLAWREWANRAHPPVRQVIDRLIRRDRQRALIVTRNLRNGTGA